MKVKAISELYYSIGGVLIGLIQLPAHTQSKRSRGSMNARMVVRIGETAAAVAV